MKACEIFYVPHKKSFRWKWRHVPTEGRAVESKESFALYYECFAAAKAAGYEPRKHQRTAATA